MRSSLYGGLAVAAILTVGLVLAACGSSSSSNTSTTAALTKAEFLKQGNAICAKGNKATNKLGNQIFPSKNAKPTQAQKTQFENALITNIQGQINGIDGARSAGRQQRPQRSNAIVNSPEPLDAHQEGPEHPVHQQRAIRSRVNKLTNAPLLTACGWRRRGRAATAKAGPGLTDSCCEGRRRAPFIALCSSTESFGLAKVGLPSSIHRQREIL